MKTIVTAGSALLPTYKGFRVYEPVPADDHACHIVFFVAKTAEWAATSAQEEPSGSASAAVEVYLMARKAAHLAEAVDLLVRMQNDLTNLYRVATRGGWSDNTPVPPSVFNLLAEEPHDEPWWKFWR